jgi:hypothetical protein
MPLPETSWTPSTTKSRRSQLQASGQLKIMQQQAGHEHASTTAIYTNPRELHQTGEKSQVARSGRRSSGLSRVLGMAA